MEESYEPIVPMKEANSLGGEPLEGRGEQDDASDKGNMVGTQMPEENMSTKLERITELARENRQLQFLSIAHLLTPELFTEAFRSLRKDASAGIDGVTCEEYRKGLDSKIQKLHESVRTMKYRAQPLKRVYIPKEDGKLRAISIPSLEDKIVQRATVTILNAIYEQDFYECSYGFRPGRSQHDALDTVYRCIRTRPIGWIVEADIRGYFDAIVRSHLMEMMERRIKDGNILR
ncbi:MAG: reverse transcriptase domain-containing protein, partial [Nitrososphaerales archaeon]